MNQTNKIMTYGEVRDSAVSLSAGSKGRIFPDAAMNTSVLILDPAFEWYGISVTDNQSFALNLDALRSETGKSPRVFTFYLTLFTDKGSRVRWSSQFTWQDSNNAPEMGPDRGYVYKVQVILNSMSNIPSPLTQYLDEECLVSIKPEYDYPIGPPVIAKFNNDFELMTEKPGIIINMPDRYPPDDSYYHEITNPEVPLSNPDYWLFTKITLKYNPPGKEVVLLFTDSNYEIIRVIVMRMNPVAGTTQEWEGCVNTIGTSVAYFGYAIDFNTSLPLTDQQWVKLGTV